jgi:hypothetical protein
LRRINGVDHNKKHIRPAPWPGGGSQRGPVYAEALLAAASLGAALGRQFNCRPNTWKTWN